MTQKLSLAALAFIAFATPAFAIDVVADSVTENATPPRTLNFSCLPNVSTLSNGDTSRDGYCPNRTVAATYTITFGFSPDADERTTGIRVWANAGNIYSDNELRVLDVEVDYLDDNGAPQTLVLNDVNIGDTANVNDPKFIAFTSVDPAGLRQATEVRLSDLRGRTNDSNLPFREVNAVEVTPPTVILSGIATAPDAPFTLTATFSEDVTGVELGDFNITNGAATNFQQVAPNVYTVTVTPNAAAVLGGVSASIPANAVVDVAEGTPNVASGTLNLTVSGALPATEEEQLNQTVRAEEVKTLRQSLIRLQDMSRGARDRLALTQRCREVFDDETPRPEDLVQCDSYRSGLNKSFDVDGSAEISAGFAALTGTFSQKSGHLDGSRQRLFFGAFDVTDDSDFGMLATLSATVAWERLTSDTTLFGTFVGAEASLSDVEGALDGDRLRFGLSGGVYAAQELKGGLYFDGFAAAGIGLNTLDLSDGTIDVDADYNAPSLLVGGALSGERQYTGYSLHPEVALAIGYTDIGNVDYDGTSGAGTAEPGHVALARLSLAPEFRVPWQTGLQTYDTGTFSVTPSLICEWVDAGDRDEDCGAGLDLELSALSDSGLHELSGALSVESIGGSTRTRLGLTIESKF